MLDGKTCTALTPPPPNAQTLKVLGCSPIIDVLKPFLSIQTMYPASQDLITTTYKRTTVRGMNTVLSMTTIKEVSGGQVWQIYRGSSELFGGNHELIPACFSIMLTGLFTKWLHGHSLP